MTIQMNSMTWASMLPGAIYSDSVGGNIYRKVSETEYRAMGVAVATILTMPEESRGDQVIFMGMSMFEED